MPIVKMSDVNCQNKTVLIREDFNVPLDDSGAITNDQRLQAAIPTIRLALAKNAAVILLSHLGRPKEGHYEAAHSLRPVQARLEQLLGQPVRFVSDWLEGVTAKPGEVVLCENVRFCVGENSNDEQLARKMAKLADVFVMDAFATAHRAQASTHGVAQYAKIACAGPLLVNELDALHRALKHPNKPVMAIVGGAKVSTKLDLIDHLMEKVNALILGGGIANTFLKAQGMNIGRSLYKPNLVDNAKLYLTKAQQIGCEILLPEDVVVATEISDTAQTTIKSIHDVADDEMILDIGPRTILRYQTAVMAMAAIIWNGPVGVFERKPFAVGTQKLAETIAASNAYTLAGGGDTVTAIDQFGVGDAISYVSTGGGAFLEFAEGKKLPAVAILEERQLAETNP